MSLDGLAIRALAEELHHTLVDGRIDKIQQPDNQSIVLTIRARGKNQRLFLSLSQAMSALSISLPRGMTN